MKRPSEIIIDGLVYNVVGAKFYNGKFYALKLQLKRDKKTVN